MKVGDMLECVITMENDDGVSVQYARERFRIPSEIR